MVAALSGLVGGAVGAGGVSALDRQPPAHAQSARTVDVPELLAKVLPGVVSITTHLAGGGEDTGSGMVISSSGEVLTNAHVVSGATSITVTRYGTSRVLSARLVGTSPGDDLALLQIEDQAGLPTVRLGTSTDVPVGAFVVAVGDAVAPFGTPIANEGIVSAEGRSAATHQNGRVVTLKNLFQTDASINPDNSGGPLRNCSGRVIGVNTAIAGAGEETGYAIPSDQAENLLAQLRSGGTTGTSSAFLGIEVMSLTPAISNSYGLMATTGVLISRVVADSPAEVSGLLRGDVVVAIDGAPITDTVQLRQLLGNSKVGRRLELQIVRGSSNTSFTVTLGRTPVDTTEQVRSAI